MADDAALRRAAAAWWARLHAPDGARDQAAFERWRNGDPAHAVAYARLEAHVRLSARLAATPLARSSRLTRPAWARRDVRLVALAAGGAIAATLLVIAPRPSAPSHDGRDLALASVVGQIRTVRLPDGTRLTLDSDSVAHVRFGRGERRITLERGRARFSVAADPARRFVVVAGDLMVFDRGTVFDVSNRRGAIDVTLITGAVEVRDATARGFAQTVTLAPGQQLTVAPGLQRRAAPQVSRSAAPDWITGLLTFDRTPLSAVVRDINRHSAVKLVLADAALGERRITGAFRAAAPAELAESLEALFGLQAETRSDGTIVLHSPAARPAAAKGG